MKIKGKTRDYSLGHTNDDINALLRGCVIVHPRPNQLFLDIDDEDHRAVFDELFPRMAEVWPGVSYEIRESPSGAPGHYHIVVTMPRDFTELERIALQAALGSDQKQALYSLVRVLALGQTGVIKFYENRDES